MRERSLLGGGSRQTHGRVTAKPMGLAVPPAPNLSFLAFKVIKSLKVSPSTPIFSFEFKNTSFETLKTGF